MTPTVCILNDTDVNGVHFGCQRVMSFIRKNLNSRGLELSSTIRSGTNWADDPAAVDAMANSNIILVNGEGTLHHGRRKAKWLLDIVDHPKLTGVPKVLINALWQDNPAVWGEKLTKFDVAVARDSASASEMFAVSGREPSWIADLSMCEPIPNANFERNGHLVGDSVSGKTSALLAGFAAQLSQKGHSASFTPIVTSDERENRAPRWTTRVRKTIARIRYRRAVSNSVEAEYADSTENYVYKLAHAKLSVTGRFHTVCLSLATRTPFVALSSNSRKIEALLGDVGLSRQRLISKRDLSLSLFQDTDWSYTQTEMECIDKYLSAGEDGARNLFDLIAKKARNG